MLTIPVRTFCRIDPAGYAAEERKSRGADCLFLVERSGSVERRLITDDRPNLWRRFCGLGQGGTFNVSELDRFVAEFGLPLITRTDRRGCAALDIKNDLLPVVRTFGQLFFHWGMMRGGEGSGDWDRLISQARKACSGRVHLRYEFEPGRDKPLLFLEPENLVAAAWIEFLSHVAGTESYGICSHCLTPFSQEKKGAKRATRRFCSTRCRTAAHRARMHELEVSLGRPQTTRARMPA